MAKFSGSDDQYAFSALLVQGSPSIDIEWLARSFLHCWQVMYACVDLSALEDARGLAGVASSASCAQSKQMMNTMLLGQHVSSDVMPCQDGSLLHNSYCCFGWLTSYRPDVSLSQITEEQGRTSLDSLHSKQLAQEPFALGNSLEVCGEISTRKLDDEQWFGIKQRPVSLDHFMAASLLLALSCSTP
eukprot:1159001-Pelagomonas_calceolata.AAC.5